MQIVRSPEGIREARAAVGAGARVGFVPTMGALHDGHLSLIDMAHAECDVVIVSIFVNPAQFGPDEDFDRYPRSEERDLELAGAAGADITFIPSVDEMYPAGASTTISVGELATRLEGADRPGHFDGVCTVVAKLFNLVNPERAYFGQKDAQQIAVVKKMVRDLDLGVVIAVCPTVREPDGVALSSRNAYLSRAERERAPALYEALRAGAAALADSGADVAEKVMLDVMAERGVDPSYARAVHPDTFLAPDPGDPILLVVAARVGSTRLIDNLLA